MSRHRVYAASILLILSSMAAALNGCAANYSQKVADHSGCVDDVGIARSKVDQCLNYGNVHRDAFDMCLARQQVPQGKIERLDSCVDARSRD
jgi:hypothetical protein